MPYSYMLRPQLDLDRRSTHKCAARCWFCWRPRRSWRSGGGPSSAQAAALSARHASRHCQSCHFSSRACHKQCICLPCKALAVKATQACHRHVHRAHLNIFAGVGRVERADAGHGPDALSVQRATRCAAIFCHTRCAAPVAAALLLHCAGMQSTPCIAPSHRWQA